MLGTRSRVDSGGLQFSRWGVEDTRQGLTEHLAPLPESRRGQSQRSVGACGDAHTRSSTTTAEPTRGAGKNT